MRRLNSYPLRVGRADAIARVNRNQDYPVHAATRIGQRVYTACGRDLYLPLELELSTRVSCQRCRRILEVGQDD